MKFEYWLSPKDGEWYYHRKHKNGQVTNPSEGYSTLSSVRRAIRTDKINAFKAMFAKVVEVVKGRHE